MSQNQNIVAAGRERYDVAKSAVSTKRNPVNILYYDYRHTSGELFSTAVKVTTDKTDALYICRGRRDAWIDKLNNNAK